jgi:ribosome-associated toxin RatA of RatAB toxin-antitoxin module
MFVMASPTATSMTANRLKTGPYLTAGLLGLGMVLGVGNAFAAQPDQFDIQSGEQFSLTAAQQLVAVQPGQVSVTGQNGQYKGQVLIQASADTAWKVLTDYDNFKNFLPNVSESRVISVQGNQKVFEQVNVFRVLSFTKQARVRMASTESYPKQVAFQVMEGDVKNLKGTWKISSPAPEQVLITHEVTVIPKDSDNKTLFFGIYKNSLKQTIAAIGKEVERRAQ